ncbi:MAG: AAA family ATPase [Planctomycetes bacterium]|nr:AAA family ATPase [Planctomycetota bacterium]
MRGDDDCFVPTGSAGTGKTSLLGAFLEGLRAQRLAHQLLASTGRAARILASKTRGDARTIHGAIYPLDQLEVVERANGGSEPGLRLHFRMRDEGAFGARLVIDEASMIADRARTQDPLRFGSGALLADLLRFSRALVAAPARALRSARARTRAARDPAPGRRHGVVRLRDALHAQRYDHFQLGSSARRRDPRRARRSGATWRRSRWGRASSWSCSPASSSRSICASARRWWAIATRRSA